MISYNPIKKLQNFQCWMAMISCSYIMSHIVFLSEPDVELDVETPPFKPVVPYDPVKARSMMTECERQVTNSCAEEGPDDWEDNVTRLERRIHYVKTWSSSLVIHGLTNSPWLSNILEKEFFIPWKGFF